MADDSQDRHAGKGHAYKALAGVFAQGFRFLVAINGIGVALTLLAAVGAIQTNLAPQLFRMPLAAFLGGLALCGVGLLWVFLVQASLFGQLADGHRRRTHWVPMVCALLAYGLSLLVFVVGCWFTLRLANVSWYYSQHAQRYSQSFRADHNEHIKLRIFSGKLSAQPHTAPVYFAPSYIYAVPVWAKAGADNVSTHTNAHKEANWL